MSTNRKSNSNTKNFRKIGNQKYKDKDIRPGARPPDAWDDIKPGRENNAPWRHAERMIKANKLSAKEMIDKLKIKWSLRTDEAKYIVEKIQSRKT